MFRLSRVWFKRMIGWGTAWVEFFGKELHHHSLQIMSDERVTDGSEGVS